MFMNLLDAKEDVYTEWRFILMAYSNVTLIHESR